MIPGADIITAGDPEAGISPSHWTLDGGIPAESAQEREGARDILAAAFEEITGFRCSVRFHDEYGEPA